MSLSSDEKRERQRRNMARWRAANRERDRENGRKYRRKNPASSRQSMLKHRYGIDLEEWTRLFEKQGFRCAICTRKKVRGWCLDHCHKSNRVRGILCHDCNTAIGFLKDDPDLCSAAAKYLTPQELL